MHHEDGANEGVIEISSPDRSFVVCVPTRWCASTTKAWVSLNKIRRQHIVKDSGVALSKAARVVY